MEEQRIRTREYFGPVDQTIELPSPTPAPPPHTPEDAILYSFVLVMPRDQRPPGAGHVIISADHVMSASLGSRDLPVARPMAASSRQISWPDRPEEESVMRN